MAIVGIESLIYGVDDVPLCTKFFEDFGLPLVSRTESVSVFQLEEGSKVVLRPRQDEALPNSAVEGAGVREVVWGVDLPENLEALAAYLGREWLLVTIPYAEEKSGSQNTGATCDVRSVSLSV